VDDTKAVELPDWFIVGTVVYLGVCCPECQCEHPCDAVCFRFSPRTFYCLQCQRYRKHKPMALLIRTYQMIKLLGGG